MNKIEEYKIEEYKIEEYKKNIIKILNRIVENKCIELKIDQNEKNEQIIRFIFKEPEWYTELDDDTKHNIQLNLPNFLQDNSQKLLKQQGYNIELVNLNNSKN